MRRWVQLCLSIAVVLLMGLGSSLAKQSQAPKIHGLDVYVVSDRVFVPGSRASLRIVTKGVLSLTKSQPMPMVQVELALVDKKGQARRLFAGRSDVTGAVDARIVLPQWPTGDYQMKVLAKSPFGRRELEQTIQLKRAARVLLVTDKPIYQPGQQINLRALVLNGHDLKPLAREGLRFEILDPKGNKVFKKSLQTNDYGIAATTFQLAVEIGLGSYQIEAAPLTQGVAEPAAKTVVVKKYVLPKFKVELSSERDYYLPRQTIRGKLQADYFFGKPVAGSEVEIKASTFDVSFREFATVKGRTDSQGAWKFEIKLPEYFVGQPLQKGDALVKLEAAVTDTADHVEKAVRSIPVADSPLRLSAVPEGGRLVSGVPNRIYAIATYPDGSPAQAEVTIRRGENVIDQLKTDKTGLALITVIPRPEDMRPGKWMPKGSFGRDRRRFNQTPQRVQAQILDLDFVAQDSRGNKGKVKKSFSTDPSGDRILLRADKAIYAGGDVIRASVLSADGDGFCYLDLIKNRQTLLTRMVPLKGGRGELRLPLGTDVFGTLELHAYKILDDGEIMRDARVVYVQPPRDLKVSVSRDKPVYRPGDQALIRFQVVDQAGKPRSAALGVIVVDEAVYALQELKPGLEKVYFTLERELSKPQYQIEFGPSDSLAAMVKAKELQASRQRVAQVLLAKAKPLGEPGLWNNHRAERLQKAQNARHIFSSALRRHMQNHPLGQRMPDRKWAYVPGLVAAMVKAGSLPKEHASDPLGEPYTMKVVESLWPELKATQFLGQQELGRLWQVRSSMYSHLHQQTKGFAKLKPLGLARHLTKAYRAVRKAQPQLMKDMTGEIYGWKWLKKQPGFRERDFAALVHNRRVQQIYYTLSRYGQESERWYRVSVLDKKKNAYLLPENVIDRVVKRGILSKEYARDIWGRRFQVRRLKKAPKQTFYDKRLRFCQVYSVGADGRAGTADDLVYGYPFVDGGYQQLAKGLGVDVQLGFGGGLGGVLLGGDIDGLAGVGMGRGGGGGGFGGLRQKPIAKGAPGVMGNLQALATTGAREKRPQVADAFSSSDSGPKAPQKRKVRVRQFFPETLLFEPALITDGQGRAELKLDLADSITTWRMTASANGRQGGLGGTSHGIRVFQDFFVDIDLPVALTQNDELSIPIVVYNYLKTPQRVRLELSPGDWFELKGGPVQEIELDPNQVSATYYRIKVTGLGQRTLQVRADGSGMSDAIRREIEVRPDGKERNLVANGRLQGKVSQRINIPASAVAGASKILVRLYPGVFSQIMEGTESMLRLPGG